MWMCVLYITLSVACAASNKGYVTNKTSGISYKIAYQALPWGEAKARCAQEGAKLAVPKSEEEFLFIQKLIREMSFHAVSGSDYRLLVWLGVSNLDHFKTWQTVDGENIENTGFSRWAGGNGDPDSDAPSEPHCVGIDAQNPGFREFWCSRNQPFMCQIEK